MSQSKSDHISESHHDEGDEGHTNAEGAMTEARKAQMREAQDNGGLVQGETGRWVAFDYEAFSGDALAHIERLENEVRTLRDDESLEVQRLNQDIERLDGENERLNTALGEVGMVVIGQPVAQPSLPIIAQLINDLAARDAEVADLRSELDSATSREASTFAELKERRDEVARLKGDRTQADVELAQARQE